MIFNIKLSIRINNNQLVVDVNIPYKYKYFGSDVYTEASYNPETFVLVKNNNEIKILQHFNENDSYNSEFNELLENNSDNLSKTQNDIKLYTKQAVTAQVALQKPRKSDQSFNIDTQSDTNHSNKMMATASYTKKSYNYNAAAKHALDYATGYDSNYGKPLDKNLTDCTNFVSQSLDKGGIPTNDFTNYTTKNENQKFYWYTRDHNSYSWKNAHGIYIYLTTNDASASKLGAVKCTKVTSDYINKLRIGDIISYLDSKGHSHHSAIITSYKYNSSGMYVEDFYLCQHSESPQKNALFSTNDIKDRTRAGLPVRYYYD